MRVKICGLTRLDDACLAQDLGAWALGFIFYPKSKRYIKPDDAKVLINGLQPDAQPVGVFVNDTREALGLAARIGLKGLQLHGDETPEECQSARDGFSGILIKALRPEKESDLEQINAYKGIIDYILLDTAAGGQYGGTGHTGDWILAKKAANFGVPVILAGGLGPDNIADAVKEVNPFATDLAGSVEKSPGIKDPEKLLALFTAIRGIEA